MTDAADAVFDVVAHLRRDPSAARVAREMVVSTLSGLGWAEADLEQARLAVTELVANAVLHARSAPTVRLEVGPGRPLRIEVTDRQPGTDPRPRAIDPRRAGGMGLQLVVAMSRSWGVRHGDRVKTVWCEIAPGPATGPAADPGSGPGSRWAVGCGRGEPGAGADGVLAPTS
ncbi:MAG TPA: ATP-binding protein [Acidimicrobiales bacterium]